jgi:hypothetical protein
MDQELLFWRTVHGIPDDAFNNLLGILSARGLLGRTSGNETLFPISQSSSDHFQSGSNLVRGSLINSTFGNSVGVDGGSIYPSWGPQTNLASEHLQASIAESFSQSSGLPEPIVPIPFTEGPIDVLYKDGIAEANIPKGRIRPCIRCWINKKKVCISLSCGLVRTSDAC